MARIRKERLDNGLQILFEDQSNRYFGDYHRVCLLITLSYHLDDLSVDNGDDESFRDRAIEKFGKELKIVKRLERMGVSTADVETVYQSMIETFLDNSSAYLNRPDYPRSLVAAELKKQPVHSFYG